MRNTNDCNKSRQYIWDISNKYDYIASLSNEASSAQIDNMLCTLADGGDMDTLCNMFHDFLEGAIEPLFKVKHVGNRRKTQFPCNAWFDNECKELKSTLHCMAKSVDINAVEHRDKYQSILREYKALIQKKKRHYKLSKLNHLENMRSNNPNAYWVFWKSIKLKTCAEDIPLEQFVEYFQDQVSPPYNSDFDYNLLTSVLMIFSNNPKTAGV